MRLESILKERGYIGPSLRLSGNERLLHDLRIMGDDWEEILWALEISDSVDWRYFIFQDYFPAEGSFDTWPLFRFNFWKRRLERKYKPITVNTLARAMQKKIFLAENRE